MFIPVTALTRITSPSLRTPIYERRRLVIPVSCIRLVRELLQTDKDEPGWHFANGACVLIELSDGESLFCCDTIEHFLN